MKKSSSHPNPKVRALIIDDEPEAINMLKVLTQDMDMIEITGNTSDPDKVLSAYLKASPDLLLLDIQLGTRTGFDVLKELHEHKLYPLVIFTTAHDQYLLKAIRAGAFDYLLKPIDKTELLEALAKVQMQLEEHSIEKRMEAIEKAVRNQRKLRFNTQSGFMLIDPNDIIYIEADWNYSDLILQNGKREVISMNIGMVLAMLPPNQFARINRSIIVNLSHLLRVNSKNHCCIVNVLGVEKEFKIPSSRIKELGDLIL